MLKKLAALLLTPLAAFFILAPATYAAPSDPLNTACQTNQATRNSPLCQQAGATGTKNPISGPKGIINTAANIIALITGIAAVIIIIISGFMFITYGGVSPGQRSSDPNKVKTARSALSGALVGLVIVALSWAIVRFVIDKFVQ